MNKSSVETLLWALNKQFPDGQSTFSICPKCQTKASRGGNFCRKCLCIELVCRGLPASDISDLVSLHTSIAQSKQQIEKLQNKMIQISMQTEPPKNWKCCGGIDIEPGDHCPVCGDY